MEQIKTGSPERNASSLTVTQACCERCQNDEEYLLEFNVDRRRSLWLCSSCFMKMSREKQMQRQTPFLN